MYLSLASRPGAGQQPTENNRDVTGGNYTNCGHFVKHAPPDSLEEFEAENIAEEEDGPPPTGEDAISHFSARSTIRSCVIFWEL